MEVSVQMVEQLNQKATRLNQERQRKLGMQESARQAFDRAVTAYKMKYGVELDDTNLQDEYDKVYAKMVEEYTNLNSLVLSIEDGSWKQKQGTVVDATVTVPQQTQNQGVIQTPVAQEQYVPPVQSMEQPAQPAVQPQGGLQGVPQAPQTMGQFIPQQANQPQPAFAQQSVQQPQNIGTVNQQAPVVNAGQQVNQEQNGNQQDISEQTFTPKGWGVPNENADLNHTFTSILGNSGIKFGQ